MMHAYENTAFDTRANGPVSAPLLTEIETHLTTVQHIASRVSSFIDRVNGSAQAGCGPNSEDARPAGYGSALRSLGSELQRLDKLSRDLEAIG